MDSTEKKHLASTATAASKPFGITSGKNMGATAMGSADRSPLNSTAHNTQTEMYRNETDGALPDGSRLEDDTRLFS